eukprot:GHVR01109470.1.p1 GENE.GHVR01109470.1~~GHVR01109470.1.p1  ORF type:complete len:144 (+),score=16.11 GHVR01109470.1:321-752(+)
MLRALGFLLHGSVRGPSEQPSILLSSQAREVFGSVQDIFGGGPAIVYYLGYGGISREADVMARVADPILGRLRRSSSRPPPPARDSPPPQGACSGVSVAVFYSGSVAMLSTAIIFGCIGLGTADPPRQSHAFARHVSLGGPLG